MQIKDYPEFKSKARPLTFPADTVVAVAAKEMASKNYGSAVITDEDGKIKGIVTERDLMRRLLAEDRDQHATKLGEIMTDDVKIAREDDYLIDWLRIMSNERFRHLPVADEEGRIVKVMSQGDFVSYTWPETLKHLGQATKATIAPKYQVWIIMAAILLYSLLVLLILR